MHGTKVIQDLVRCIEDVLKEEGASQLVALKVRLGALAPMTAEHFEEHFLQAAKVLGWDRAHLEIITSERLDESNSQDIILESLSVM